MALNTAMNLKLLALDMSGWLKQIRVDSCHTAFVLRSEQLPYLSAGKQPHTVPHTTVNMATHCTNVLHKNDMAISSSPFPMKYDSIKYVSVPG